MLKISALIATILVASNALELESESAAEWSYSGSGLSLRDLLAQYKQA